MIINAKSYINGKWINSDKTENIYSIFNNDLLGTISNIDNNYINLSYKSSYEKFLDYRNSSYKQRKDILLKMIDVLDKNKEYLSNIMAHEIGKKMSDCISEITRSIEFIKDVINIYNNEFEKQIIFSDKQLRTNKQAIYTKDPLGAILCIVPFNYPINLLISKIVPALIVGNTVIIKPSIKGSLVTYEFIRLLTQKCNLDGIVQLLIIESGLIRNSLFSNKYLSLVNFTGSTNVGFAIVKKNPLKKFILELGGKDAAVVLDDANLEKTCNEIINGSFNFNGQRCTAIKRVIVSEKIHDKLIDILNQRVSNIKCGSPFDNDVLITPLISSSAIDFAKSLFEDARKRGAKIHQQFNVENNILKPIIMSNINNKMLVWKKEQFCPILPVVKFKSKKELIKLINDTEYGLQCSIFTSDNNRAIELANDIQVATININKASSRGPDILPFFGIKNSGRGVQGIKFSLESMTRLKGIVTN